MNRKSETTAVAEAAPTSWATRRMKRRTFLKRSAIGAGVAVAALYATPSIRMLKPKAAYAAVSGPALQGCSPGFWKNHTPWPGGYHTGDYFDDVFGAGPHVTLLAALGPDNSFSNPEKQLLFQGTAALLNAASSPSPVNFPYSEGEVKAKVQAAYADTSKQEATQLLFAGANSLQCPLS